MYLIKTGRSVDEAVSEALTELNKKRDEVEVEIIEEASKGFLGLIGSKEATVKVTVIEDAKDIVREIFSDIEPEKSQKVETEEKSEPIFEEKIEIKSETSDEVKERSVSEQKSEDDKVDFIEKTDKIVFDFIGKVMGTLGIDYEIEIERVDNFLKVNILGDEEKLGIVIGKRGVTLDSIQYILSLLVNKHSDNFIRVIVDASNYRKKREKTLTELAERMAEKVVRTGRNIRLEPMNAQERRIIHFALQSFEGVATHSEGRDPYRKVVIQKEVKY